MKTRNQEPIKENNGKGSSYKSAKSKKSEKEPTENGDDLGEISLDDAISKVSGMDQFSHVMGYTAHVKEGGENKIITLFKSQIVMVNEEMVHAFMEDFSSPDKKYEVIEMTMHDVFLSLEEGHALTFDKDAYCNNYKVLSECGNSKLIDPKEIEGIFIKISYSPEGFMVSTPAV